MSAGPDIARVAVVVVLAACGLLDILLSCALILNGALAHAAQAPLEPRSLTILAMIAAGLAAPPFALAYFKRNAHLLALVAIVVPLIIAFAANRFGI